MPEHTSHKHSHTIDLEQKGGTLAIAIGGLKGLFYQADPSEPNTMRNLIQYIVVLDPRQSMPVTVMAGRTVDSNVTSRS